MSCESSAFSTTGRCPAKVEEIVESYLLGRLTGEELDAFEDHYFSCPRCSDAVRETQQYILAIQAAASRLR